MSWVLAIAAALLAATLGAVVGLVVSGALLIAAPTIGSPLDPSRRGTAVLLLDLQVARLVDSALVDVEPWLDRIVAFAGRARGQGIQVVAMRTVHTLLATRLAAAVLLGDRGRPGAPGTALHPLIAPLAEVFDRPVDDALWSEALETRLEEHGVGRLVLVGLDGADSVQRTARGARRRGYEVVVVEPLVRSARPARWEAWRSELEALGVRFAGEEEALSGAATTARS